MKKTMRLTSLAAVCLALSSSGCGGSSPTGPGPGPTPETFRGSTVFDDDSSSVFPSFSIDVRGSGTLDASLTWTVAAPGTGRFGGNAPELLINLIDPCSGGVFDCPIRQSRPRATPPVTLSAPVERGTYSLVLTSARLCGGCRVDYTLTVMHP